MEVLKLTRQESVDMKMSNPCYIEFSFPCPFCRHKVDSNTEKKLWFCDSCLAVFSFNSKKDVVNGAKMLCGEVSLPELVRAVLKSKRRKSKLDVHRTENKFF
jgi:ribosomal protein L37AE/L43A